jgi:hypothetical protein
MTSSRLWKMQVKIGQNGEENLYITLLTIKFSIYATNPNASVSKLLSVSFDD